MVRHPASLEVVGGKKKVKTDRIDARRMVRAPRAWDGGDRDAMSRVRVPTVAEEDSRRLLRRRERPVRERRRLANAVGGLTGLHGLCGARPERPGFRERPVGMETGYGTPLPPEPLAEIGGMLDRLELVAAELKVAGAGKAEILEASGRALDSLHADADRPPAAPAPRKEPPGRRGRAERIRPVRPLAGRGRPRRTPTTRRRRAGFAGSARTTR